MELEYYKTEESVKEYIKLAEDVNGEQLINKLKPYLSEDTRILEIGSGPGLDWNIFNREYDIIGSDFSNEFLSHLRTNNPNGKFLNLNAVKLETELKFDCLYSNKVLHHLNDDELVSSVKRQFILLNDNGIICHSFWKGEGNESFKGMFVNYHKKDDLIAYFTPLFDILEIEEYKEFEESDSLLLIGRKK